METHDDKPAPDLEALRREILEGGLDRAGKIDRLKVLIEHRNSFPLLDFLLDLAGREPGGDIREFVVRSYGYLEDPGAATHLLPYLESPDPALVVNAMKSLTHLDPELALQRGKHLVRSARHDLAYAIADVLAERLGSRSESLFLTLAFARRSRYRALSLYYLKRLPPAEAVPILLEMQRRERKSGIRRLLVRLLQAMATSDQRGRIQQVRRELLIKAGEIGAIIQELRDRPRKRAAPTPGPSPAGATDPRALEASWSAPLPAALAPDPGAVPSPALPSPGAGVAGGPAGTAPEPAATRRGFPAPPAGLDDAVADIPLARLPDPLGDAPSFDEDGVSASQRLDLRQVQDALRAEAEKQDRLDAFRRWKDRRKGQDRRTVLHRVPGFVDDHRRVLAVVFIMLGAAGLLTRDGTSPLELADQERRREMGSPLGYVGSVVKPRGRVTRQDVPHHTFDIRTPEGYSILAYFPGVDVTPYAVQGAVTVEGILREVRAPDSYVVVAHRVRPLDVADLESGSGTGNARPGSGAPAPRN